MPSFDLRGINVAAYSSTGYSGKVSAGDAMSCNLELKYAEGRLYAEGKLAEYLKLATGGTCSIAVKYIPEAAQKLMFGFTENSRTVGSAPVKSLKATSDDVGTYVGLAFYAPDKIDGATKYTCVFVPKVSFGAPSYAYATKGDSITFNTPTTTGEFMPDQANGNTVIETAVCDTAEAAIAWCDAVLGG